MVDVVHPATLGFFGDGLLRLALGAHEEDRLPEAGLFGNELQRFLEELERLLQVDDVNAVALAEDVFLHLRIPVLGLVPEVNTCFEQFLFCQWRHDSSIGGCARVSGGFGEAAPDGGIRPSRIWTLTAK